MLRTRSLGLPVRAAVEIYDIARNKVVDLLQVSRIPMSRRRYPPVDTCDSSRRLSCEPTQLCPFLPSFQCAQRRLREAERCRCQSPSLCLTRFYSTHIGAYIYVNGGLLRLRCFREIRKKLVCNDLLHDAISIIPLYIPKLRSDRGVNNAISGHVNWPFTDGDDRLDPYSWKWDDICLIFLSLWENAYIHSFNKISRCAICDIYRR